MQFVTAYAVCTVNHKPFYQAIESQTVTSNAAALRGIMAKGYDTKKKPFPTSFHVELVVETDETRFSKDPQARKDLQTAKLG